MNSLLFSYVQIEDGDIFASINQKDGMVVFLDNPEKYNSARMFRKIEDEMKKCMETEEQLRKMDQEISLNPRFVHKIKATEGEMA